MNNVVIVAHRGGQMGLHENRLETIKQALQKDHIDAVEIDLRVTADGILVIHHDRAAYVNGKKLWIDRVNYADIKFLGIPTLEEVLDLFTNSAKTLYIDNKDEKCIIPLKNTIERKKFNKKFYLACFDLNILLRMQEEVPTGEYFLMLNPKDSFDFNRRFVFRVLLFLMAVFFSQLVIYFLRKKTKKVKVSGMSIYYKFASDSFVRDLQTFGFKVFVWGMEKEFETQKFLARKVDGLIIDESLTIFENL